MNRILLVLTTILFLTFSVNAKTQKTSMPYKKLIEKIDALTEQQKNQAALELLKSELSKITDPLDQARAITKSLQLEMSLHGYETAVKDMKTKPWPKDTKAELLLNTYYGRALQNYAHSYSWEIRKREKTVSNQAKDLKTWTTEEIFLEAYASYYNAWKNREKLNELSKNELDDFINANTYPAGVKDKMRDTLSYLFVSLIEDTSGWSPEQKNEIFKLNLSNLMHGKAGNEKDLTNEKAHPLIKIAVILEDLRAWNEKKKNIEGALESQLELFRILHSNFTQSQDREYIRAETTKILNSATQSSWYSMVAATLAEFWKQDSAPDSLNQALNFASKGAEKYPSSLGAGRCRDIIKEIENPNLSITTMRYDGTGERTFGVKYKNIKKVFFRTYKFDIKDYILSSKDYSLTPNHNILSKLLKQKSTQEWKTDLEATTDYKEHWHYVTPPNHENGFYIVVASIEPNFGSNSNIVTGAMMSFGPLVVTTKNNYKNSVFEIETLNGADGKPIAEVKLEIYKRDYQNGNKLIDKVITDSKGRAEIKAKDYNSSLFWLAEYKNEVLFSEFYVSRPYNDGNRPVRTIIYTDRSIYRPQQKIQWKTIFYQADEKGVGRFHIVPNNHFEVSLHDMNGEVIQTMSVKTDAFGAAAGEFSIPTGRALGQWMVTAGADSHSVRVEEYKRPTFELSWSEQKTPIRLNHNGEVIGEARYYFGQALNKGKVKYKIEKTVSLPWWCYWGFWDFSFFTKAQIVKSGDAVISEDGKFKIEFKPEADSRAAKIEGIKYNYKISVDVTDEGGETRSSSKTVMVAKAAVEATWGNIEFINESKSTEIALSRNLIAGGPAPGKGKWELVSLKEPEKTVMPADLKPPSFLKNIGNVGLKLTGDQQVPRWAPSYNWKSVVRDWKQNEIIKSGSINSDDKGAGKLMLPELKAGTYRLIYSSKDQFGEIVETQTEFFVANKNYQPKLPLLFFAEEPVVKVGENIKLWLPTGIKNQTMIFEVFQDQELIERRYLKSDSDSLYIEWLAKEEHRGGLGFSIRFLNDYQSLVLTQSVYVPWDNKDITIETKTFRDKLNPGQKEKWSFVLKGPKGEKLKKASAQLLAYMYDRSLDALAPHSSPLINSIYPYRYSVYFPQYMLGTGLQAYFEHNLYYGTEYSSPSEDSLDFYPSYGIGGPGERDGYSGGRGRNRNMMMSKSAAPSGMGEMASAPAPSMMADSAMELSEEKVSKKSAPADKERSPSEPSTPAGSPPAAEAPKTLRTNFSETAFFFPIISNNDKGEAEVVFEIPDSVTSWTLWLHAFTKDLMAGSLSKQIQTTKDLMVRPYLPRFLREGDLGQVKVVVNNTSDKTIEGKLDIEITDENQKENISKNFGLSEEKLKGIPFKIAAQKSFDFVVAMKVPAEVGLINFKAVAKGGNLSDGELRGLPILPGRFHLMQSRFVSLNNKERREISFAELAKPDDPTRISEKMVVQVDAQLFYSVLSALPYLVNEPYECVEQTLNRFLSTGILTSVFNKYPSIDSMAKKMSSRKTRVESFAEADPNRKMAMEETPWLMQSRGGPEKEDDLVNVLDSSVARHTRADSLLKLEKAQNYNGGFPWFAGGRPSPYITLYVLHGFSKALEFGVEVPKPMIQKAWNFMHSHYITEIVNDCMAHDSCWETITFLNYVLSNYPDESWSNNVFSKAERETMLNFSFKHWKEHSPYLKGYLALTLHRAKKADKAKLVWDSVMDSAKYTKDEGTHWQREDRSWLWYNDTVETQAFALRTLLELKSDNVKRDGIVEWLFLNKKLNHWKSTRATAEVIYSLAQYLTKTDQLGKKEAVRIKIGQEKPIDLNFNPDEYTGKKNQIVYEGDKVKPALMPVVFEKETPGLMFASTTWHFSTEKLPEKAEGDFLSVDRKFFLRQTVGTEVQLKPISEGHAIEVGDEVEVQLSLRSKHAVEYVHLRDPRGSGFEPTSVNSQHKWDLGVYWYEEIRDSGTNFFFEYLPQGEYTFKYRIRASMAGEFQVSPATLQPMYAPEFAAYSSGQRLKIK